MKKVKKKTLILLICIAWLVMCITDFALAMTCHRPIFCVNMTANEHYEEYSGIGYSFDIVDNSEEFFKIDGYQGYLLGIRICGNYME